MGFIVALHQEAHSVPLSLFLWFYNWPVGWGAVSLIHHIKFPVDLSPNGEVINFFVFMHLWIFIYLMYFNTLYLLPFSMLRFFHLWAVGVPSSWLLCLLTWPWLSLRTFLLSGMTRYSRLTLHSPGINHFSKEHWFLLVRNCI